MTIHLQYLYEEAEPVVDKPNDPVPPNCKPLNGTFVEMENSIWDEYSNRTYTTLAKVPVIFWISNDLDTR